MWAALQPLDKAVLSSQYDDVELLGKALRRDQGWYGAGLVLHLHNGALFGALYALVAPSLPLAPPLRGPACALTEHLVLWPLGALSDRLHPARDELPRLWGNHRAFAQATVRHLLFGVVLGELERRLGDASEAPPPSQADYSSNGHGSLEHALSA
jgi:hypothetical protein